MNYTSVITFPASQPLSMGETSSEEENIKCNAFCWVRNTFIFVKCLSFIYKSAWTACRYRKTHKKCCQFEIWYLCFATLKIAILLPAIYLKEINYLYFCFLLDSCLIFWLGHMLQIRCCIILKKPMWKVRCYQFWISFRLLSVLACYITTPLIDLEQKDGIQYNWHMNCTDRLYPYRFLVIFVIDFISALVDLILMFLDPTYFNSNERLRFARQQIIFQSSNQAKLKKTQNHYSDGIGDGFRNKLLDSQVKINKDRFFLQLKSKAAKSDVEILNTNNNLLLKTREKMKKQENRGSLNLDKIAEEELSSEDPPEVTSHETKSKRMTLDTQANKMHA